MAQLSNPDISLLLVADRAEPLQLQPPNFDEENLIKDIRSMKKCMETATGTTFEETLNIQDAYFIGWVAASLDQLRGLADADNANGWFVLRFSNFGRFSAYWNTNSTSVDAKLLRVVEDCSQKNGFFMMSAEMLQSSPYTGIHEYFRSKTWWDRFFDYD